jgi:oligogalacturonide transporter
VGFVSHAEQSPEVLTRFFIFFLGGPTLLIGAGVIIAFWFHLNPINSTLLVEELARLRAGGALDDASAEMKEIGEKVSGQSWSLNHWP